MIKKDFKNMSDDERLKALAEMPDEDIDYSDIPELDEEFLRTAKIIRNPFNLDDENQIYPESQREKNIIHSNKHR